MNNISDDIRASIVHIWRDHLRPLEWDNFSRDLNVAIADDIWDRISRLVRGNHGTCPGNVIKEKIMIK